MSYQTIGDLVLVLEDLFGPKKPLLEKTLAFKIYGPTLEQQKNELAGVTAALKKKPLAEDLSDTDIVHDSSDRAIFYICKGLGQLAILPKEQRDFVDKTAQKFAPSLGDLNKSYEDEAAAAKKRENDLNSMKKELEAFPVAPNMSLFTLVSTYIEAGKKIDALLSNRAETVAADEAGRVKQAAALRSRTVGVIGQLREALVHEVSTNPELPRDLESKIFSYYDQIGQSRDDRRPKPPATETPAS